MTLEKLQEQMISAMKNGDKPRKTAISGYIAAIKKVAIDKGCRDNIPEEMVNETLTKLKKQAKAAEKEAARIAKLSPEKRKAEEEAEAKLQDEFNALRKAAGKPTADYLSQ